MAETDWYSLRGGTVRSYIEEKIEMLKQDMADFPDEEEWEEDIAQHETMLKHDDYTLGMAWMNSVGETYWNASDNVCEDAIMLMSKPGWENEL